MNILHTSDWHLGRTLYGKRRFNEFQQFLNFLDQTIEEQNIDILLIAGDIFDTSTPSHQSQQLYYDFLYKIAHSRCRHLIIIGGNHDSPAFLNAPKNLLKTFNIYIIGKMTDNLNDEVLILKNPQNQVELLVCAVPYLRDRDIRRVEAGESTEDKTQKVINGIADHYQKVAKIALAHQQALDIQVPIIGMGHLFSAGGKVTEGDGVRDLYIGSLAKIGANIFADCFDYVALGHLHVPQKVNKREDIRYSGSPIAMGFGEAKQQKIMCLIQFNNQKMTIETLPVPTFQPLLQIKGNWTHIEQEITTLINQKINIWLEIIYTSNELMPDLQNQLNLLIQNTLISILKVKNNSLQLKIAKNIEPHQTLENLTEQEVFELCLKTHQIPEEQQPELLDSYQEIRQTMHEADKTP